MDLHRLYQHACELAAAQRLDEAYRLLARIEAKLLEPHLQALVHNAVAAVFAARGDIPRMRARLEAALLADPECSPARANQALLASDARLEGRLLGRIALSAAPIRVAVISLLTGSECEPLYGHTSQLAQQLAKAGFVVKCIAAQYRPWNIDVPETESSPAAQERSPRRFSRTVLRFDDGSWTGSEILSRYRCAINEFDPDCVVVSESSSFMPLLVEAGRGLPVILRLGAMELACPLNGLRWLPPVCRDRSCPLDQFTSPGACRRCVERHGHLYDPLRQQQRSMNGFGLATYQDRLLAALWHADEVLVTDPEAQSLLAPHARSVRIVTCGVHWPLRSEHGENSPFQVPRREDWGNISLHALGEAESHDDQELLGACQHLRSSKRRFAIVRVLSTRRSGLQKSDELIRAVFLENRKQLRDVLAHADLVIVPNGGQECLGLSIAEAMAAGRPVLAPRTAMAAHLLGESAGVLLYERGDHIDLASKLESLMGNPSLCRELGVAVRQTAECRLAWNVVIERGYRNLLRSRQPSGHGGAGIAIAKGGEKMCETGRAGVVPNVE